MFGLELAVVLASLAIGARVGSVGLGVWGGMGLAVLTLVFGLTPTAPPIDVLLIILAVIIAAAVMEAAGGIDCLVNIAEHLIRGHPRHITIVAPLVTYAFTFCAGTGHIVYPLLPVIYEVAYENQIRPERPLAIATIASQQAITASPVSAATVAMFGLLGPRGIGLGTILAITVPATLLAVLLAALVQIRAGKELRDDPEYQRRLAAGELEKPRPHNGEKADLRPGARLATALFLTGVALVVLAGAFPSLRPVVTNAGKPGPLTMPMTIEITMLAVAALILLLSKVNVTSVLRARTFEGGITAVVGIFGLAWMGDTFIQGNAKAIMGTIKETAGAYPPVFALGLFIASVFLYTQAATTYALMPLGLSLGIPSATLIAMFPAVNGYFFIPNYGSIIAAIAFDRTGTTRIGTFIFNHSFMLPGLIATGGAVGIGLTMVKFFF